MQSNTTTVASGAFGHGLAPAACPFCRSTNVRLIQRHLTDPRAGYDVYAVKCHGCATVFDDSGKVFPDYLTAVAPLFSKTSQRLAAFTKTRARSTPYTRLTTAIDQWATFVRRIQLWQKLSESSEAHTPARLGIQISTTHTKETSTMSEPTKTIETTAAAATKPKVDRMWYPSRRETFAVRLLAALIEAGEDTTTPTAREAICTKAVDMADDLSATLAARAE